MATTTKFNTDMLTPGLLCGNRVEEADMPTDFATIEMPASEFFAYIWLMKEWNVEASASFTNDATFYPTAYASGSVEGKFTRADLIDPDTSTSYISGQLTVRNSPPIETVCGKCRRRVREEGGVVDETDTSVDDSLIPEFLVRTSTDTTGSLTVSEGGSEVGNCSFEAKVSYLGYDFPNPVFRFGIGAWCFIAGGNVRVEVIAGLDSSIDFLGYNEITTAIAKTGYTQLGSTFTGTVFGQNITMRVLFSDVEAEDHWGDIANYEANVTVTDAAFSYDIDVTEFWVPT